MKLIAVIVRRISLTDAIVTTEQTSLANGMGKMTTDARAILINVSKLYKRYWYENYQKSKMTFTMKGLGTKKLRRNLVGFRMKQLANRIL